MAGRDHAATHIGVGSVAGAANILSGYPFDTIKVRLQRQGHAYRSAWHCLRVVVREEGVRALFRGVGPPVIGGAAETAVNYLVYMRATAALAGGRDPSRAPLPAVAAAAATAGAALSPVLSPAELLKVRLQAGEGGAATSLGCLREGLRREGARFLSRGLSGTLAREVPGNAVYFTSYEALQRAVGVRSGAGAQGALGLARDMGATVLCGGAAGMLMWAVVLPVDICKTRLQLAQPGGAGDRGLLWQARRVVAAEGWRGLYAGFLPVMARAFPANAAQWVTWEAVLGLLSDGG